MHKEQIKTRVQTNINQDAIAFDLWLIKAPGNIKDT